MKRLLLPLLFLALLVTVSIAFSWNVVDVRTDDSPLPTRDATPWPTRPDLFDEFVYIPMVGKNTFPSRP